MLKPLIKMMVLLSGVQDAKTDWQTKSASFDQVPLLSCCFYWSITSMLKFGLIVRAHSVHFKKKFVLHSQFFAWRSPKYCGAKLQRFYSLNPCTKNSEQATCFWTFNYRKCIENIGKNAVFADFANKLALNPQISLWNYLWWCLGASNVWKKPFISFLHWCMGRKAAL